MTDLCNNAGGILKIVGYVILVLKIAIPIILLLTGAIAFGSAVIASDEKEMQKATKKLINKAIAAIVIFFLPTLINMVFSLIEEYNEDIKANYSNCWTCVLKPSDCQVNDPSN